MGRWIQGALWLLAIVAVGTLWWFPDALSRLRTLGTPYAEASEGCDLAMGPCSARFSDGVVVSLTADPQPARSGETVDLAVEVDGVSTPVALELQGADMAMGFLRHPLVAEDGRWTLSTALPVCSTDRMRWKADVVLDDRVAGFFLWSTR